mgnify:CR=1 FL=1
MGYITKIFHFFLKNYREKHSREEKLQLFDVEEYKNPTHANYKKCPNCGFESHTNEEIRRYFGVMHKENYTYIQSWCRECRKGHTIKEKETTEHSVLFD